MSDLRAKLLQAGLVTKKQVGAVEAADDARRAQQQSRPKGGGRGKGRPGSGGRRAPGEPVVVRPPDRSEVPPAEDTERAAALLRASKKHTDWRGGKRFYFLAREGTLPFLEVGDKAAKGLERGELAIVEDPSGNVWVAPAAAAREAAALDPAWIRHHRQ